MTGDELRAAVAAILAEERQPAIDWARVQNLYDSLIHRLNTEPAPEHRGKLYHFIEDYDVREKDELRGSATYAEGQRAFVEDYLRSG